VDRGPQHLRAARKTLGGSSSINGPSTTAASARISTPGRSSASRAGLSGCAAYFKRWSGASARARMNIAAATGNLTVTTMDWQDPLCEAFMPRDIARIPRNPDYNGRNPGGRLLRAAHDSKRPARQRGDRLPAPGDETAEVHVRTHAHATGIILDGKRAVGVRYVRGGKGGAPMQVRAAKEVILAGGTYNSPQLLQLSGHSAPGLAALARHRGAPRTAGRRRGIAGPLRARSVARVKNIKTINERRRGLSLVGEAIKWATTRRGLLSLSPTMVYCFWHSGETTRAPICS